MYDKWYDAIMQYSIAIVTLLKKVFIACHALPCSHLLDEFVRKEF